MPGTLKRSNLIKKSAALSVKALLALLIPIIAAAQDEEILVDAYFVPETREQKLAHVFNYLISTRQSAIPCHLLGFKYYHGYPADTVGSDYPNGVMSSTQYKNSWFSPIHEQYYEPGEKSYYKAVFYGYVSEPAYVSIKLKELERQVGRPLTTEEVNTYGEQFRSNYERDRSQYVAEHPDGEFVGWIKYDVVKEDRPLSLTIDGKIGADNEDYQAGRYHDFEGQDDLKVPGDRDVLPVVYRKVIKSYLATIYNELHIVTEKCVRPSMRYVEGDYTDVKTDYLSSIVSTPVLRLFFQERLPVATYSHREDETPTVLAFWDHWNLRLKATIERLDQIEKAMKYAQAPAYMVPFVGTGLSAIDCYNAGDGFCWEVALDAASDALLFAKIPAAVTKLANGVAEVHQAAKFSHKYLQIPENTETYITGVRKFLDGLETGIGGANLTLAAIYLNQGEVLDAATRGFAGSFDVGLFNVTKQYFQFIPLGRWRAPCETVSEAITVKTVKSKNAESIEICESKFTRGLPDSATGAPALQGGYHYVWISKEERLVYKRPMRLYGDPQVLVQKYIKVSDELLGEFNNFSPDDVQMSPFFRNANTGDDFYASPLVEGFELTRSHFDENPVLRDKIGRAIQEMARIAGEKYPVVQDRFGRFYHDLGDGYVMKIDKNVQNFIADVNTETFYLLPRQVREVTLNSAKLSWIDPFAIGRLVDFEDERVRQLAAAVCDTRIQDLL